jgi:hypothetical protein
VELSSTLDHLLSLAEVAGVFVGFAALVSTLKARDAPDENEIVLAMNVVIVITSALAIFAALLPVGIAQFNLKDSILWRVSSMIMIVLEFGTIYVASRLPGFSGAHRTRSLEAAAAWVTEIFILGPLILCALNVLPEYGGAFYFLAVLALIVQAIFLFVGFVVRMSVDSN